MNIKFNWGTGIIIFLILFFISIFWFVFFSFSLRHDLVEKDYYPKILEYEKQIQKQKNLVELGEEVKVSKQPDELLLQFPQSQKADTIKGQILIYRPSDTRLDQTHQIQLDTLNEQKLSTSRLTSGKYILKIAWTYQGKAFYQEISIII